MASMVRRASVRSAAADVMMGSSRAFAARRCRRRGFPSASRGSPPRLPIWARSTPSPRPDRSSSPCSTRIASPITRTWSRNCARKKSAPSFTSAAAAWAPSSNTPTSATHPASSSRAATRRRAAKSRSRTWSRAPRPRPQSRPIRSGAKAVRRSLPSPRTSSSQPCAKCSPGTGSTGSSCAFLELGVKPSGKNVGRSAVRVVGGIGDELIVDADFRRGRDGVAVVGLDDLLQAGVRKYAVADEDAEAAGVEERLVDAGNAVDDAGDPDRVVRPAPLLAGDRHPSRYGAVDVGEIPRLDIAVRPSRAHEHADRVAHLLLEVHAHARPAGVGPHGVDVGGQGGRLRERERIRECSRPAAAEKTGDLELARLSPKFMSFLDFADQLELVECGIEIAAEGTYSAGRRCREIEDAAAQRPAALIPFGGRAIREAQGVGRIVERAGIDQRPVEEIGFGIVRIFVGVEYVDDRELPDGEHEAVRRLRAGELIDVGGDLLGVAAEIAGLAHEKTLAARGRIIAA